MFAGLSCMGCHVQFRQDLLHATLEAGGLWCKECLLLNIARPKDNILFHARLGDSEKRIFLLGC